MVGSPGGSLIIGYEGKTLVATLDWNLDMQSAIDLPNAGSRGGPTGLEKGTALESRAAALKALGHDVRLIDMTSGLAGIRRTATGWEAGADPRREGAARKPRPGLVGPARALPQDRSRSSSRRLLRVHDGPRPAPLAAGGPDPDF